MTRRTSRRSRAWCRLAPVALAAALGLCGCGKPAAPAPQASAPAAEPAGEKAAAPAAGDPRQAAASAPAAAAPGKPWTPPANDPMHQPFAQATRGGDEPPAECGMPPDVTVTGKPVFRLLKQVRESWDAIHFVGDDGKPLTYTATIDTSEGTIEVLLRPDLAPNHVRSFVALARAGYYDGLAFDRVRCEQAMDDGTTRLEEIEAGCPLGTGETGSGSIGYWLNPEFAPTEKVTHDEGTLGAVRGFEEDTAACRFYITLNKAPWLDGHYTVFGKVTRGLDVARTIFAKPVVEEDEGRNGPRRPKQPVVIKSVKVEAHPAL